MVIFYKGMILKRNMLGEGMKDLYDLYILPTFDVQSTERGIPSRGNSQRI